MPQLDISTYSSQIFWLIICFFSLLFIMSKFIVPRIKEIMEQRQSKIDSNIEQALKFKEQAEKTLAEYQKTIAKATQNAMQTLEKTRLDLQENIAVRQTEFSEKLSQKIKKSEADIELKKQQAFKEIDAVSIDLATDILKKIGVKNNA